VPFSFTKYPPDSVLLPVTVVALLILLFCKLKGADASAFKLLIVMLKISLGSIVFCLSTVVAGKVASFTLLKYTIFFVLAHEDRRIAVKKANIRGNKNLAIKHFYALYNTIYNRQNYG
jgi:hypothetical protein